VKHVVLLGDRNPSYLTHRELDAALTRLPSEVRGDWVDTDSPDASRVSDADGLWVVPGSPYRDEAAVYAAITSARTSAQPFLGTCGGFQYAVLEFARNAAGLVDAAHAESAPDAGTLVIDQLSCSLVGEERAVTAIPGTRMHGICGGEPFSGFHWCRFGLAPDFVERLVAHGLTIGARAEDAGVEAIELAAHPFFVATLFQPQMGAAEARPLHPVLRAFVDVL
jgi:CTP synthase (UTP-ammonia lyase)